MPRWLGLPVFAIVSGFSIGPASAGDEATAFRAARESIVAADLKRHVDCLSDDTFEGREAGSRGGRAAGIYLAKEFQRCKLAGGGVDAGYFQGFNGDQRNLLGILAGGDETLKDQFVVVGAHYDHVGYGNAQNSFGPTGYIHNGADDNASGSAGLVELVEAFAQLQPAPRRSILFALWDGEEQGLLGSKHWTDQPTVPLDRVTAMLNMDMIGRLRDDRLEVFGVRTAPGLREIISRQNGDTRLAFDFNWDIREDSDHYPFCAHEIPYLMLHTGLHDDYHRPGDDAEKIENAGMERVVRLAFGLVNELANRDEVAAFRPLARSESQGSKQEREKSAPRPASRFGVSWDPKQEDAGGVRLASVTAGAPAARAGLMVGDRLVRFADQAVTNGDELRRLVNAAKSPVAVVVERQGKEAPLEVSVELVGPPIRLGITWRTDDAEPGVVILSRVAHGTPAADAGLRLNDRVLSVSGNEFADGEAFRALIAEQMAPLTLEVERAGRIEQVILEIPE